MAPLPLQVADAMYKVVLERIQVDASQSPAEQLKQVLLVSDELILTHVGPDVTLHPVIDRERVESKLSSAQWGSADVSSVVPGTNWCRRLFIGDCQHDVSQVYRPSSQLRPLIQMFSPAS